MFLDIGYSGIQPSGWSGWVSVTAPPCWHPLVATVCAYWLEKKDHTLRSCQAMGEKQAGALPSPVAQEPIAPAEIIFLSLGLQSLLKAIFKLVF